MEPETSKKQSHLGQNAGVLIFCTRDTSIICMMDPSKKREIGWQCLSSMTSNPDTLSTGMWTVSAENELQQAEI
ncbi:hypothetical protein PENSUB_6206 [Penicillium subrubescens]|uniref:Uncharacterized protein n=1 Tax=Penicillium subrubescens TaxID=1316194 RepID=A0A1Q5U2J9_9EURO|nr:hypothetical protein PENSUB_6206 [Penicillium subrubescens]